MPRPTGKVILDLKENGCHGYDCSIPWASPPRIIMFRSVDRYSRWEFLHELGHVFDWQHRRVADRRWRARLEQVLGWAKWEVEPFAMAYSWCARNPRWPAYRLYPGYYYWPTVYQHRAACRVLGTI